MSQIRLSQFLGAWATEFRHPHRALKQEVLFFPGGRQTGRLGGLGDSESTTRHYWYNEHGGYRLRAGNTDCPGGNIYPATGTGSGDSGPWDPVAVRFSLNRWTTFNRQSGVLNQDGFFSLVNSIFWR